MKNYIIVLIVILVVINSCNTKSEESQSKKITSSKTLSPNYLINEAQEYYANNKFYKCLASLSELEEKYPNSEECKKGLILKEKAINATVNKIEGKTMNKEKNKNSYNHVLAVEISSNNVDEKVIEDRKCQTNIWFEGSNIVVSGYLAEKSYYKILSTGTFMYSKYYEVKTDLKESTFLFDDKSNSVVWQQIKHDNSGIHVYFENK
jgi:ABC-type lipoprotein release transport system permease subunit